MSSFLNSIPYPEVHENYRNINFVGRGSYGIVYSAKDRDNNQVIIKVINNAFSHSFKSLSSLREMSILRQLNHPNIPKLYKVLRPPNEHCSSLCLIEENCGENLKRVTNQIPSVDGWAVQHIKFIIYELFSTLKYLHSARILHRDIKPDNILINGVPKVKLIDYGLSRQISTEYLHDDVSTDDGDHTAPIVVDNGLTPYVVTRNYRAPELSLKQGRYDGAIDVFSVGCVMYELFQTLQPRSDSVRFLNITPLFRSGCDSLVSPNGNPFIEFSLLLQHPIEHLHQIISILGSPSDEDLEFIVDEELKRGIREMAHIDPVDWNRMLPYLGSEDSTAGIDLMKRCLEFNPHKRITADEALSHPYLSAVRHESDETTFSGPINFDYENLRDLSESLKMNALRQLINNEINLYY